MDSRYQSLVERWAKIFCQSGCEKLIFNYDVDDLMWSLVGVVAAKTGIDFGRITSHFNVRQNDLLSPDEQQIVIDCFGDTEMFRNIQFYPGVSEILLPERFGAEVHITTNSFTSDIADAKIPQVLRAVPGLAEDRIHSNIIGGHGNALQKKYQLRFAVNSDDSPFNIAAASAPFNVMPRWLGWTHDADAIRMLAEAKKEVVWLEDFATISQFNYELARAVERRRKGCT